MRLENQKQNEAFFESFPLAIVNCSKYTCIVRAYKRLLSRSVDRLMWIVSCLVPLSDLY